MVGPGQIVTNAVAMLRPVDLHRQPGLPAKEVDYEGADPDLALELEAFEAPVAEARPEQLLRFRHGATELSETGQRLGAVDLSQARALTLPKLRFGPLPLPIGRGIFCYVVEISGASSAFMPTTL
jgi:hypothetical protein